MEEADQYILLYPDMFVSLIASALNDILYSLYWIIGNDKSDMAKTLFEHFLKETEPIFKETSTYGPQFWIEFHRSFVTSIQNFWQVLLFHLDLDLPMNQVKDQMQ